MTKNRSTKRALLLSALSLLLCVSMLVGSTFAWFTDSVTSAGNIIKSGTLQVEMHWADGTKAVPAVDSTDWTDASTGAIFNYDLWEPGYTEVRHIKIENKGTLALKYQLNIVANGEVSELADVIDVYYADPAAQVADRTALVAKNKIGTLTEVLANMSSSASGNLEAGQNHTITLALKMQESANNDYQDLAIGSDFSVQLMATQLTSETDSFNNRYDAPATYPKASQFVSVPENATEPISLVTGDLDVEIPSDLLNDLPDEIQQLQLVHTEARADAGSDAVVFDSVEILDQNGNKVDLEAMGNTTPIAVTLPVSISFAAGERVNIYHDGEYIATTNVNTDGTITYEAMHFCEVSISDTRVAKITSAEELIAVLTDIKTEAKKQIPGATGNKSYRENALLVLENDIVIDANTEFMYTDGNGAPLHFYGVNGTLDLNGHSITVTADALLEGKAYANAVLLVQYSNIDIIGEGSIIAENQSIPVYGWANGTVNIYGGTYISNAFERNESAIYVNNTSMVIHVYGGNYAESVYAFNAHDNCGSNTVMVLHEGVSYPKFLKNGTADVITSDFNAGRLQLADGCALKEVAIDGEAWYQVVKE